MNIVSCKTEVEEKINYHKVFMLSFPTKIFTVTMPAGPGYGQMARKLFHVTKSKTSVPCVLFDIGDRN